jgi:hypothetical protein
MAQKLKNKIVYYEGTVKCLHNILTRKSGEGHLLYCKIGAKSEGYTRQVPLVSTSYSQQISPHLS